MTTWTSAELDKIGAAEELEIAPRRRDGTLRNPVTSWVVRLGDDLYVRSWRGRSGAWFRTAQAYHEGRIWAGGVEKDVTFVEVSDLAKLAQALITIASEEEPRRRFIAGADAIDLAEQKVTALQEAIDAYPELSTSLALEDAQSA